MSERDLNYLVYKYKYTNFKSISSKSKSNNSLSWFFINLILSVIIGIVTILFYVSLDSNKEISGTDLEILIVLCFTFLINIFFLILAVFNIFTEVNKQTNRRQDMNKNNDYFYNQSGLVA